MTDRAMLARDLRRMVGADAVITDPTELATYDCDAYTIEKALPTVVVLPQTTEQVVQVVRYAVRWGYRLCRAGRVRGCRAVRLPSTAGSYSPPRA